MKARNRLKVILAEKEMLSKHLGEKLGVSRTTVSKWVNNKQQPPLQRLYHIAEVLDVHICDLLVSNDRPKKGKNSQNGKEREH